MVDYASRDAPRPMESNSESNKSPMKAKKRKMKGRKMGKYGCHDGFAEGILAARGMGGCYGGYGYGGGCGYGGYGGFGCGIPPFGMFGFLGGRGGFGFDGHHGGHDGHHGKDDCCCDNARWLDTQGSLRNIDREIDNTDRDVLKSATETCKEISCAISNLKDMINCNDGRINDKICCEAQRIEKDICQLQHAQDLSFCNTNKTISDTGFILSKEICNLSKQLSDCCCKLDIDIREVNHTVNDTAKDTRFMMLDGFKTTQCEITNSRDAVFGRIGMMERCMDERFHKITCNQKELAKALCEIPKIIRDNAVATSLTDSLTGITDPATLAKIGAQISRLGCADFTCQPCIAC